MQARRRAVKLTHSIEGSGGHHRDQAVMIIGTIVVALAIFTVHRGEGPATAAAESATSSAPVGATNSRRPVPDGDRTEARTSARADARVKERDD
jgi:hypothetical protein